MESLNFEQLKADIHRTLISKLDLEKLAKVQPTRARQAVATLVDEIVFENKMPLNAAEKEKIQADLLDEVFGLGPLEALLRDPKVSDILVNNKNLVYIERGGILEKTDVVFATTATSCRSSIGLSRKSAEEWTNCRQWWTRDFRMAPV